MSIYAYVGMPGSGKSYDVVANQVVPSLKAGRRVVTNIPLHLDKLRAVVPHEAEALVEFPMEAVVASPEKIWEYATPGSVLVLDEVWRLWPAGQKANQVPEPFRKLLAEHRHMVDASGNSMQVVLVTQDLAQIAAFARQLVESTFYHTKLTAVGMSQAYRIDVYQGPQTGPNPPRNARLREIFGKYDKAIFELYVSHTMSESGKAGANEKTADTRANVWKRPMIWVSLVGIVAAFAWGLPTAISAIKDPSGAALAVGGAESKAAPGPSASSMVARATPSTATSPSAQPGRAWRVVGFVEVMAHPERSKAILSDGSGVQHVALDQCRRVAGQPMQCRLEGVWYSETGVAKIAAVNAPL